MLFCKSVDVSFAFLKLGLLNFSLFGISKQLQAISQCLPFGNITLVGGVIS